MEHRVEVWHRAVILPLRALRTDLKTKPALSSFEPSSSLRDDVKALELRAERIELEALESWLRPENVEPLSPNPAEMLARLVRRFQRRELSRADADAVGEAVRLLAEQAGHAA